MAINNVRTNQIGSVTSFIIGGVVLVAIVIGGLYFLNKRSEQPSPKASPVASNGVSTSPSVSPQISSPASPKPTQSTQPTQPPVAAPNTAAPLPATGPDDLLPVGIIIAIITGLSVSYLRSRGLLGATADR